MTEETSRPEGTNVLPSDEPKELVVPFEQYRLMLQQQENFESSAIWDDSKAIGQNLIEFINGVTGLPDAHIQTPIAASYLLIPSALSDAVFNLFCFGQKGSGKTDFAEVCVGLHNAAIVSSNATYVSLRNIIEDAKWRVKDVQEKNSLVVFDNLPAEVWEQKPDMYTLFVVGIRRGSDLITVSSGKTGENLKFRVFGTKVVSSIFPLFLNGRKTDCSEFRDRCLILWFESDSTFEKKVFSHDHSWLHEHFSAFWNNPDNALLFIQKKAEIKSKLKRKISGNRKWLLAVDLLTTGIVTGIWDSLIEAENAVSNFLEYQENRIANIINPLSFTLREYIEKRKKENEQINLEYSKLHLPEQLLEVSSESLKTVLDIAKSEGLIDSYTSQQIALAMNDLGFVQARSEKSKKLVWIEK